MVNTMVERATSYMLIRPYWAMNLEICDMLNSDPTQAKDVVKGTKKRIGSRNPKAQLLVLTDMSLKNNPPDKDKDITIEPPNSPRHRKVLARCLPAEAQRPIIDEASVFSPSLEEFEDTLAYIEKRYVH